MKRKYEVAYYAYGLTEIVKVRFFHKLAAYLYKGYIEYKFEGSTLCATVRVLNNE